MPPNQIRPVPSIEVRIEIFRAHEVLDLFENPLPFFICHGVDPSMLCEASPMAPKAAQ